MGRLLRPDTIDPRTLPWATPVVAQALIEDLPPNRLGTGERAVIAYAQSGCVAGLDDLRARQLAETMGLQVVGWYPGYPAARQTDWPDHGPATPGQ